MLKPRKSLTARKEIKEDKFVTFYFKAQSFLEEYKNWLGIAVIAIVAVVALSLYIKTSSEESERVAASKLAEAKTHFASANYAAASSVLGPWVAEHGDTRSGALGTILLAKSFLAQEQYNEAAEYFNRSLEKSSDDAVLSLAARLGLASCHDQQGNYQEAAVAYEAAAEDGNFKASDILLDAARCYELANQIDDAKRVLNQIINDFPNTAPASTAQVSLAELKG